MIIPIIFVLVVGIFLAYWLFRPNSQPTGLDDNQLAAEPKPEQTIRTESGLKHTSGSVIIQNRQGKEIAEIKSVVVNGNWITIPACAGLGGDSWIFRSSPSEETRIEKGILSANNPAGLWQIGQGKEFASKELSSWNRGAALEWHSYDMTRSIKQANIKSPKKAGLFTSVSLPRDLNGPGIFTQGGQIVGWTFGRWMERGLLWDVSGNADLEKQSKITIAEFNNAISPNWREAHFSKGLALKNSTTPQEKLKMLAEGFLYQPQFPPELKPRYLQSRAVAAHMNTLASQLIQTGLSKNAINILNDQILLEAADPELLKNATLARIKISEHWKAARYFERMKKKLSQEGVLFTSELERFHARIYKDWIQYALEKGEAQSGRMAYETGKRIFPEDATLHVLGIQLAVSERNWDEARQLLSMRSYPQNLQEQVKHLEQLITEKLDEKNTVHLRFTPGSKEIVLEALINRRINQYFILDTGATHVTISPKTADQLGFEITEDTPVRPIRTASDVMLAYEVTLDSIEIGGLRAENIIALIIDLPGIPGVGLLGNNFLNHFNVEIDNKNGLLKLSPR